MVDAFATAEFDVLLLPHNQQILNVGYLESSRSSELRKAVAPRRCMVCIPRRNGDGYRQLHTINYLCEYSIDKGYGYRFALEAKPNEPRADMYFPTTGAYLAFIATLDHSDIVGVNPEVAHEHMAGLNMTKRFSSIETAMSSAAQRTRIRYQPHRAGGSAARVLSRAAESMASHVWRCTQDVKLRR